MRYELISCALHGHALLTPELAATTDHPELVHRPDPASGFTWLRCLRCDAWLPVADDLVSVVAADEAPVVLPARGRPLRDRFVLRLIAIDRVLHFIVFGALAVGVLLFAQHRQGLRSDYTRFLNALQSSVGGSVSDSTHVGLLHSIDRLFEVSTARLYLYALLIAGFALINGVEAFGLWGARRWAEYLTFVEVVALLPIEVYEVIESRSAFKIIALVINLAVVGYLLWVHRLFGVRGGGAADRAETERDTGWEPLTRTTPWYTTTTGA
jgi:uncharacterized membrane protein (DUF2068 family)